MHPIFVHPIFAAEKFTRTLYGQIGKAQHLILEVSDRLNDRRDTVQDAGDVVVVNKNVANGYRSRITKDKTMDGIANVRSMASCRTSGVQQT